MSKADLIKKKYGRYSLTVRGRVVYEAHTTIGKALMCYWKLKAIESIETSPSVKLPKDDLAKLVDTLIDNQQIGIHRTSTTTITQGRYLKVL